MSRRDERRIGDARGETRATLTLAWPMAGSMLALILTDTVDVVMIGHLGEEALAAAALGFNYFILFVLFAVGATGAVSALGAQAVGAGDARGVRRTMRQGLWFGLLASGPCIALMMATEPLLVFLGQDPGLAAMAQGYLDYLAWTMLPLFLILVFRNTMAAFEVVRPALLIVLSLVPMNVALNWVFMFGGLGLVEPMGLPGAALATLIAESAGVGLYILYLLRAARFRAMALFQNLHRADWPRFRALLRIGLPAGGLSVVEHAMFVIAALMMGLIGMTELAAYHIATQVLSLLFVVPFGLSQAAAIRIGAAAGARDLEQVRLRGRTVFRLTAAAMGLFALLLWLLPETLIALFVNDADPKAADLIALGAGYLVIAAVFQLVDGLQIVACGALRGLNDTIAAFWLGLVGYIAAGAGFAWLFAFPLGMGGAGVWWGLAVGLALVAGLALARFQHQTRSAGRAFRRLLPDDGPAPGGTPA